MRTTQSLDPMSWSGGISCGAMIRSDHLKLRGKPWQAPIKNRNFEVRHDLRFGDMRESGTMSRKKITPSTWRIARDATFGLLLFSAFAITVLVQSTTANSTTIRDFLALKENAISLAAPSRLAKPSPSPTNQIQRVAINEARIMPVARKSGSASSQQTSRGSVMVILALIFMSVVAFSLAFARHFRQIYARSRRQRARW